MKKELYTIVGTDRKTGKVKNFRTRSIKELARNSLTYYRMHASGEFDNIHLEECDTPVPYFCSVILQSCDDRRKPAVEIALKSNEEVFNWYGKLDEYYRNVVNHSPSLVLWSMTPEKAEKLQNSINEAGGCATVEVIYDNFFEKEDFLPAGIYLNDTQKKLISEDINLQRKRFGYNVTKGIGLQDQFLVRVNGKINLVTGKDILPYKGNEALLAEPNT